MWVLSTDRAELHFFSDPEVVPDGFAALSHVWDQGKEQSFHDVRRIQNICAQVSRLVGWMKCVWSPTDVADGLTTRA